jgi:hypothetical protein
MNVADLQRRIGATPDGVFGPRSRTALFAHLSNPNPTRIGSEDIERAAADLQVAPAVIRAITKVEAPRGAFDLEGRPALLYERHVFARNTLPPHRFDHAHPALSGKPFGAGGYGPYSAQYGKLAAACALDPAAAFKACSWGMFQILGEGAEAMGYASAIDMAEALVTGEAAHLDSFVRFVGWKRLADELRACRAGDPQSCVPFVRAYNGAGYAKFDYHRKLAAAILEAEQ